MSVRAMKAGAADFLPKPFRDQDMLDAVAAACLTRAAAKGETKLEAELKERFSSLTPREVGKHWARTDPEGRALPKYYDRVLAAIRANRYQAFLAPL